MNSQRFRLREIGDIDRTARLKFKFDGKFYEGYRGDSLASALLANGVHLIGRSFKYHRPRGLISAGAEEPNALIQLGEGNGTTPNLIASQIDIHDGMTARSQNRWPTLFFDVGFINNLIARLIPAGFYYKTFMWPRSWWMKYEHWIRRAAGLGKAPGGRDPDKYEKIHAHCDVLIVGAGPAGIAAALSAGKTGARIILADEQSVFGGSLNSNSDCQIDGQPAKTWGKRSIQTLETMPEVTLLSKTTVTGYYEQNYLTALENVTASPTKQVAQILRQRLWKIRAQQVILATGAIERPLVFRDNDRPGVMLSSAFRTYINKYGVTPGQNSLIFTNNDDAYRTAIALQKNNVKVVGIVDVRESPEGKLYRQADDLKIPIFPGHAVVKTKGHLRIRSAEIMKLTSNGRGVTGPGRLLQCDSMAISGGWNPAIHLFSQSGGKVKWDEEINSFIPDSSPQNVTSVGSCAGKITLIDCVRDGLKAGIDAARATNNKGRPPALPAVIEPAQTTERLLLPIPGKKPTEENGKVFVDFQNDVTLADIHLASREGYNSIEHLKRYTTVGMGTDQGKTSNINALILLGGVLGRDSPATGHTTFRPPYTPATLGAYAGRNVGSLFSPVRTTAIHAWHKKAGAKFEHVGQWMRAWYYPNGTETMKQAVDREVHAARTTIGLLDASTLGKIDIQGPDSAEFLNRVYTNSWLKLAPGKSRYGLMLKEDGMIFDDGVTTCLAPDHFHMTTTTGGAANVLEWLEEWLQTEWPHLQVYLTSVTEQWAVAAICGPRCRQLLKELCSDVDLSEEAFPFMEYREGTVAGIKARIYRISFTGETSFEINVSRRHGSALWSALIDAGQKYDLCPYGTEAMHVLRAEKGFIIVGQETDGTVTPLDLGMEWLISKKKPDFIGKRGLSRSDIVKPDRKQLVGLLTEDANEVLPEGSQIVENIQPAPPMQMIGHVTSSYHSPNCQRSIAMALIKGGRKRMGQTVHIPLRDKVLRAIITKPIFLDKESVKENG
ncbi:MAG: sarcosine oxidase subunit alpha [Rhodospirillaceae bacterium]|nr:sarcosine oxidase subunit alpha [Rhodospirillaceae bacterium]